MTNNPPTTGQHTTPMSVPPQPSKTPPSPPNPQHDNRTADGRFNTGPGGSLDLDHVFTYHTPHGDQVTRYGLLRDSARRFAEDVARFVPSSPERSTALSRIREAVMWANAAIACNERDPRPTTVVRYECPVDSDCEFWVESSESVARDQVAQHVRDEHTPAMDDPYAGVTVDVPTPTTQQAVCMITHEPPWCDGPCKLATPVQQNTADIPMTPVLDVNAADPVAEARRYASAVEAWHAERAALTTPQPPPGPANPPRDPRDRPVG